MNTFDSAIIEKVIRPYRGSPVENAGRTPDGLCVEIGDQVVRHVYDGRRLKLSAGHQYGVLTDDTLSRIFPASSCIIEIGPAGSENLARVVDGLRPLLVCLCETTLQGTELYLICSDATYILRPAC